MANLFTPHHDTWHVHKTLGFLCLLHMVGRASVSPWTEPRGRIQFSLHEPFWFTVATVLMHFALAVSSTIFQVPIKRPPDKTVIWATFRGHNILFATRHVVFALLSLLNAWEPLGLMDKTMIKFILVASVNMTATWITMTNEKRISSTLEARDAAQENYHSQRNRQTIRNQPWGVNASAEEVRHSSEVFRTMQLYATLMCCTEDPLVSFLPVLGIQSASFLMTLNKKAKIDNGQYAYWYNASLRLTAIGAIGAMWMSGQVHLWVAMHPVIMLFKRLRWTEQWEPYAAWAVCVPAYCVLTHEMKFWLACASMTMFASNCAAVVAIVCLALRMLRGD